QMCSYLFFTSPATTEIYTLSLHDALPILAGGTGNKSLKRNALIILNRCPKVRALFKSTNALAKRLETPIGSTDEESAPPAIPTSDRKSTRLNSSHVKISYAVFCLKKKKNT